MANFRKVTAKTPLIMGRKTWESFPKRPLPGRPNIVATRNLDFLAPSAFVFSSLPPALAAAQAMAAQSGVPEVSIIGGAEIYAAGLALATHMTLTDIEAEREANVFSPPSTARNGAKSPPRASKPTPTMKWQVSSASSNAAPDIHLVVAMQCASVATVVGGA